MDKSVVRLTVYRKSVENEDTITITIWNAWAYSKFLRGSSPPLLLITRHLPLVHFVHSVLLVRALEKWTRQADKQK